MIRRRLCPAAVGPAGDVRGPVRGSVLWPSGRGPGSTLPGCCNLRSIVADLRAIGPALWDRFTMKDPAAQLWYYQSRLYHGKVLAALSEELDRVVAAVKAIAVP
jgi:hypothetical protein